MRTPLAVIALALSAALVTTGCDRDRRVPEVASNTADRAADASKDLARQAEQQTERAVAVLDDVGVTTKVKTALIAEPNLSGMSIDVDTTGNVVTLKGTVRTDSARARAEEIARSTEGVKEVRNDLIVQPTS